MKWWWGGRCGKLCGDQFFRLIEAYISNLSLLLGLEPSEKFVVVVVVESDFSVKLWPKPS